MIPFEKHCYFLLLIAFASPLFSQTPQPAFRHYTTDDGLPSPEVYEVLQDQRGYMWFGTDHGVSRFNGYEFENFGVEKGLKDNVVFYLQEDPRGRIWMVSSSERLYYYDYALDSIITYAHNKIIQEHIQIQSNDLGFFVDSLGTVYRCINRLGILKIFRDGSFESIPQDTAGQIIVYEEGTQYFFTRIAKSYTSFGEINLIYYRDTQVKNFKLNFAKLNINIPGSYFLKLKNNGLLGWLGGNYYLFREGAFQWQGTNPDLWVISAWQDQEGKIYLGGRGKGVQVYNNEQDLKDNIYTTLLPGYSVSHIFQDRAGGFWFTTTEDGVFYAPDIINTIFNQASGLPADHISSIQIQQADSLWIATKDGSVVLMNPSQNQIELLERSWGEREVSTLQFGPDQQLWLGTGSGIYRLNNAGIAEKAVHIVRPAYSQGLLFPTQDTGSLLSMWSGGFIKYDYQHQKFIFFSLEDKSFNLRLNKIFEDRQHRVWLAANTGLYLFQEDSLIVPVNRHPNMSLRVEDIAELPDSTLVIGTKGAGLLLWKDETFREISVEQGLISSMVEQLHVDAAQNIWVGSFEGLSKISLDGKITNFTMRDGLPSNEITTIDSYGEQVWVGTTKGLIKVANKKQGSSRLPLIASVEVNNEPYKLEDLKKMPFQKNNIQLNFLSLDYTQDGRINYRYRLGANAPWNYTRERLLNFSALKWGNYRFEIQSQNKDGQWSESTHLPFSIRPPFWNTWWFWLFCILTVGFIVWQFYRNRIKLYQQAIHVREIQLEREKERAHTEKQISELQASAMRAQMNPHFIFNCLNSIQSFIASGDKTEASRYLARFAKLVRSTLNGSLEDSISLEEEISMLENYLSLEQMRFDRRFSYTIKVADDLDTFDTTLPPLLVQPFIENAIVHGLVDTSTKGKVNVYYQRQDGHLLVKVTDNGIGLSASKEKTKGEKSAHKSVGMTLTKKRLALLEQSSQDDSIIIKELKDEAGKVLGTEVTIRVAI